jgi:hypothetical protein
MSRITATPASSSVPDSQEFQDPDTTSELLTRRVTQASEEDVTHIMNSQKPGSRAGGSLPSDQDLVRQMLPTNAENPKRETSWGWFGSTLTPSQARHKWFTDKNVRQETMIGSDCLITSDLHNGFIDFKDLSLRIPGELWCRKLSDWITITQPSPRVSNYCTPRAVHGGSSRPVLLYIERPKEAFLVCRVHDCRDF